MPISGVLLTCDSDRVEAVRQAVDERPLSEIREVRENNLIVVTDTPTMRADRREVEELEAVAGVIAAHVVFSSVEDLAEKAAV